MQKLSVKKNYLYNVAYQILTLLVPFITTPYVSRVLGADGVGAYSYSYTISSYFALFGVLGTNVYGQQIVAQHQDDENKRSEDFWEINIIRLLCTFLCLVIYLVFTFNARENRNLLLILSVTILANVFDISWFFQGMENFRIVVVRNAIVKLITTIGIFVLIKEKDDLALYVACLAFSTLAGNISFWFYIKGNIQRPVINCYNLKKHFCQTVVYFIPQVAYHIYGAVDKLMIGVITKSSFENGYYEQAHKIINMLITIIASLNIVMRSRISYLIGQNNTSEIKKSISFSYKFFCLISFPLMLGLLFCAEEFVPVFFGEGYDEVKVILKLFIPIIFATGLNNLLGIQYLTPIGKQGRCNIVLIIAAIVNIIMNVVLIPRYKSIGATIASVTAETIVAAVYVVMSKEILSYKELLNGIVKYGVSSVVMGLAVYSVGFWHIKSMTMTLACKILVGFITYTIILLFLKDELAWTGISQCKMKVKGK